MINAPIATTTHPIGLVKSPTWAATPSAAFTPIRAFFRAVIQPAAFEAMIIAPSAAANVVIAPTTT